MYTSARVQATNVRCAGEFAAEEQSVAQVEGFVPGRCKLRKQRVHDEQRAGAKQAPLGRAELVHGQRQHKFGDKLARSLGDVAVVDVVDDKHQLQRDRVARSWELPVCRWLV